MAYRVVEVAYDDEAAASVITLNRPEVRNALNQGLYEELDHAVRSALADERVHSIILTGKGSAFAAGADIEELQRRTALTENGMFPSLRRELARLLEAMPKPTIAALNGHAIGGGLELALACNIRVAVPQAKIGLAEITLGILPGNGGTQRLVKIAGLGVAMEMVLTGEPISAEEARARGVVHKVVPPDELMPTALGYARTFAKRSSLALAAAKETVLAAVDVPMAAGISLEAKWFGILCSGPDKEEGVRAFLEKRPAQFRGPEPGPRPPVRDE
ncbi:MAG: enoyl-CoA hydratase/isomerase family protein [Chloroflexota bacterium]|nr:enoyl-CoA hydratase/isomerase family protein [Chloroflexota bacterium]